MASASAVDTTYEHAVEGWAAHLRAGGTTPWSAWRRSAAAEQRDPPHLRPLPDAIHLELVRRINLAADRTAGGLAGAGPAGGGPDAGGPDAGGLDAGGLAGLADRVFATAAPGRGLLDVPLPWPTAPRRFGTPAVDPSELPDEELIRLGVGVLAHLLPDVPRRTPRELPPPWPAPWRRRFRLHGAPSTVAAVRRSLLAQRHIETDWRPTHVVIARPVEVMMAEHWSAAVRNGGILKWSTTWRRAEAAGRLPAAIDVTAIARRLQGRRREPLHLVVARDADRAAALVAHALRTRHVEIQSSGEAALSDLLRRLNRLTALTHGPGRVRDLAETLVALLDEDPANAATTNDAATLVTPPASLPWAREVAATAAEDLRSAGYAVHGDPDALAPTEHRLPGTVDRERTLELAVAACLRTWPPGGKP